MKSLALSMATSLVLLVSAFVSSVASAGILVEPYIGFEKGKTVQESGVNSTTHDGTAAVIGGRFGYTLPILFWLGLDYSLTSGGKGKSANTSLYADVDYKRSDLYLVAGFDFPILVRAWLGYGLMNDLTADQSGTSTKVNGGTHTKIGVGFTGLPFVSVNLELYNHAPTKSDGNAFAAGTSFKDAGFTLTASLPLDL